MIRPASYNDLIQRYGKPWDDESSFEFAYMVSWRASLLEGCTGIKLPDSFPSRHIFMNHDMVHPWNLALVNLSAQGLLDEIKSFGGCWNIRKVRGAQDRMSIHSWGLALDFNTESMPLGSDSKWTPEFIRVMREAGFVWGGDWERKDPMHFQWCDAF